MSRRLINQYKDYQAMIISVAMHWRARTGWELDDLVGEGNLVFVRAVGNYDRAKASFSTYLYTFLNLHYQNMYNLSKCKKNGEWKYHVELMDDLYDNFAVDPEKETAFQQLLEGLSLDAKEVVEAVFEIPSDVLEALEVRRITKYAIYQYFILFRGWTQTRVWDAFEQVQEILR